MKKEIKRLEKEVGEIIIANHNIAEQIKNLTDENLKLIAKLTSLGTDIINMKKEIVTTPTQPQFNST